VRARNFNCDDFDFAVHVPCVALKSLARG
jgi:hypothetical protein